MYLAAVINQIDGVREEYPIDAWVHRAYVLNNDVKSQWNLWIRLWAEDYVVYQIDCNMKSYFLVI